MLHNLDPFLQYLGEYVPEVQAFFANITAATQENEPSSDLPQGAPKQHLLTTMPVLSPESLAIYPNRIGTNRGNAYPHSGAYSTLGERAAGVQLEHLRGLGADGRPTAPSTKRSPRKSSSRCGVPGRQRAFLRRRSQARTGRRQPRKAQRSPGARLHPAGPFTFNGQTSQFPHAVYSNSTPDK